MNVEMRCFVDRLREMAGQETDYRRLRDLAWQLDAADDRFTSEELIAMSEHVCRENLQATEDA